MEGFRVQYQPQHHCWNKYWMDIGQPKDTIQAAKKVIIDYKERTEQISVLTKYPTRIKKITIKEEMVE